MILLATALLYAAGAAATAAGQALVLLSEGWAVATLIGPAARLGVAWPLELGVLLSQVRL